MPFSGPMTRALYTALAGDGPYEARVTAKRSDGTAAIEVYCPGVAEPVTIAKVRVGDGPGTFREVDDGES